MNKLKTIYLFPNNMVAAFDFNDEQVLDLQGPFSEALYIALNERATTETKWHGFEDAIERLQLGRRPIIQYIDPSTVRAGFNFEAKCSPDQLLVLEDMCMNHMPMQWITREQEGPDEDGFTTIFMKLSEEQCEDFAKAIRMLQGLPEDPKNSLPLN